MRAVLTWLLSAAVATPALAASSNDNGPWLNALTTAFVLLDLSTGDLDGDGRDESVLCYRQNLATTDQGSGVVVLQEGAEAKPVFHVQLEGALCEKVRVSGRRLGVLLAGNKQLAWTYGEDLKFSGQKGGRVAVKSVSASSTLGPQNAASKLLDNDLATSWAEGAAGTGIGESVTVVLDKAVDVGAVAVFCGEGSSQRNFFDRNRIHRGSIEVKTAADLGDSAAGIDFSALGIDAIGDRVEFSCENKPEVHYVHIGRKDVLQVQLRIDSVYLGDKKDDAHVAELEIVPMLDPTQTLDRAKDVKVAPTESGDKKAPVASSTKNPDIDVDDATKKLDGDGRSIVPDDF
jgi:hypothetical protein